MEALTFVSPAPDTSRTKVAPMPTPHPGRGDITTDVHYAGINFKNVMSRRGDVGYVDRWPFVPGLEVTGTVREIYVGADDLTVANGWPPTRVQGGWPTWRSPRPATQSGSLRRWSWLDAAAAPGTLLTAELLATDAGGSSPMRWCSSTRLRGPSAMPLLLRTREECADDRGYRGRGEPGRAGRLAGYSEVLVRDEHLERTSAAQPRCSGSANPR